MCRAVLHANPGSAARSPLASRYGCRRITALLRTAGWQVGKDRVQRIWRREGLKVPEKQKPRKRLWFNDGSCVRLRPERANHVWSYDFVSATTHDGKTIRRRGVSERRDFLLAEGSADRDREVVSRVQQQAAALGAGI